MGPEIVCRRLLPPHQLREAEIAPAVLEIARGLPGIRRVVRELGLSSHTSRIDVAAVTDQHLVGFEIKSDVDRLAQRWRNQCGAWERIFDYLWIVITDKHLKTVFNDRVLTKIVPDAWGVFVARIVGPEIHIFKFRDSKRQTENEKPSIMSCLWKSEASKLVHDRLRWKSCITSTPIREWYPRAADELDEESLRCALREALVTREHLHKRDGSV